MANLWDKTAETSSPSELNPLTNPLLERNLGRWAQVYLSTPPAKREQAVNTLLAELKRESGGDPDAEPVRPYFARDTKFEPTVCSICQRQNPAGHRFCSRCGQPLDLAQSDSSKPGASHPGSDNRGANNPGVNTSGSTDRGVTESGAAEFGVRQNVAPPIFPGAQLSRAANDVQWLRDRRFAGLGGFETPPRRGWKYLLGAAIIVLVGFAYVRWSQEIVTPVFTTATPHQSVPGHGATAPPPQVSASAQQGNTSTPKLPLNSPSAEAQRAAQTISSVSKAPEALSPAGAAKTPVRTDVPAGIEPAAQKSPLLGASSRAIAPALDGGASDLRLAQRYLAGSMGARDSSEAAKLLWKAVSKQNASAAVLLSELYLRGDGVPRSCDQARLLLIAAAKRGAPQAAQPLRNLESQGCR